jgi:GAF domain-containing protein
MKPELIDDHVLLINDVMDLLKAERGFIVLYDAGTQTFGDYVATRNFHPLPENWKKTSSDNPFRENHYLWDLMTTIAAQRQPVLTNNANVDAHFFRTTDDLTVWVLRCILAVPLIYDGVMYGLLWCDQRLIRGVWQEPELVQIVDLIRQFLR